MKIFRNIFWLLGCVLLSVPLQAKWEPGQKSSSQTEVLNQVERLVAQTPRPVVIFDLDSTLYDTRIRNSVIWKEYGVSYNIPALKKVKPEQITSRIFEDYFIKEIGMDPEWVSNHAQELRNFWLERFFDGSYLKHDRPLPGAVEYVKALYRKGAYIVYVSGRDIPKMGRATENVLRRDGFPWGDRTKLLMKPESNLEIRRRAKSEEVYRETARKLDMEFKKKAIQTAKNLGTVVASFDNEPSAINHYYQELHAGKHGKGLAVWLDTDFSLDTEPPKKEVLTVVGFKR